MKLCRWARRLSAWIADQKANLNSETSIQTRSHLQEVAEDRVQSVELRTWWWDCPKSSTKSIQMGDRHLKYPYLNRLTVKSLTFPRSWKYQYRRWRESNWMMERNRKVCRSSQRAKSSRRSQAKTNWRPKLNLKMTSRWTQRKKWRGKSLNTRRAWQGHQMLMQTSKSPQRLEQRKSLRISRS